MADPHSASARIVPTVIWKTRRILTDVSRLFAVTATLATVLFAATTLPGIAGGVATSEPRTLDAAIDDVVREEMAAQHIPGVAIGVAHGDSTFKARGYGYANVEHQVPAGAETIFQSGSLGKQFTAVAVMLQVEDGKLRLSDRLTSFFPDAPRSWESITVRHLLTHTSGIPDYTDGTFDYRRDYTEEQLTRFAYKLKLEFPAGARWNYSNTGYLLLGVIVHKVSGRFYGDVLAERVFKPLGMSTARVISEADIVPHRAAGYRLVDGELKNQEWVAPALNTTADGALYLSVQDMLAWNAGVRGRRLLRDESWKEILQPVRLNSGKPYPYGFGWALEQRAGQRVEAHGGAWQGFKSYFVRFVGDDLSIIVFANLAQADPGRIADRIAAAFKPSLAPATFVPIEDREPDVTARMVRLLDRIRAGNVSRVEFAYVRAGFFPDLPKEYAKLLAAAGPLRSTRLLDRKELGDDRVYLYELGFGTKTMLLRVALAPDDRIAAFGLQPSPAPPHSAEQSESSAQASFKTLPPQFADPERPAKLARAFSDIDRIFQQFATDTHVPGAAWGVVIDGELAHSGTIGYRDVATKAPVRIDSVFRIASMTKSFTAMSILKLRDEGKLSLDDPVDQYVPELRSLQYPTSDSPRITIRHLLSHAEGFPEDNPWGDRRLADSDAQLTDMMHHGIPFSNAPGIAYEYSNYGFAILGRIVSRVSGVSYTDYVMKNVVRPLGMTSTTLEPTLVPPDRLAHGYRREGEQWREEPLLSNGSFGSMGGMLTTVPDLSRYVAAFLGAWPPRDGPEMFPVRRASLREMQQVSRSTPAIVSQSASGALQLKSGGYGYGLRISETCAFQTVVAHSGGLPGFGSQMRWLPEHGIGIIAFGNLTYTGWGEAIDLAVDALAATGALRTRVQQPSPALVAARDKAARLVVAWDDAAADSAAADNLFLDRSKTRRRAELDALHAKVGACTLGSGFDNVENALRGDWTMNCERGKLRVAVTLAPTLPPKIQYFEISPFESESPRSTSCPQ